MGCIYVIRTFIRTGKQVGALAPTICFERNLALEMAQADEPEIDGTACGETEAKPPAAFDLVPNSYSRIGRDALLAAAPMKESVSVR